MALRTVSGRRVRRGPVGVLLAVGHQPGGPGTAAPRTLPRLNGKDFTAVATGALEALSAAPAPGDWLVNRIVGGTFTVLETNTAHVATWAGSPLPLGDTLCGQTGVTDRGDVVEVDLRTSADPRIAALAATHGLAYYLGVGLRDPRGKLLGTLCGLSHEPVSADLTPWKPALRVQAAALSHSLTLTLAHLAEARQADLAEASRSADAVTGLPDRHGWGLLLIREEARAARLGEQVGVVLADLGKVYTSRAARRAVAALREAVGDRGVLARTGARQVGVVVGGAGPDGIAAVADDARAALRATRFKASTGWAARNRADGMIDAWWQAEDALLAARAAAASR